MKPTILFVILPLLSACSLGRKTPNPSVGIKPVPMSGLSKSDTESLRSAEKLKAYPLGRYIDPNNSRIMHEAHTLYRVESPSYWNLRPGPAVSLPLVRESWLGLRSQWDRFLSKLSGGFQGEFGWLG